MRKFPSTIIQPFLPLSCLSCLSFLTSLWYFALECGLSQPAHIIPLNIDEKGANSRITWIKEEYFCLYYDLDKSIHMMRELVPFTLYSMVGSESTMPCNSCNHFSSEICPTNLSTCRFRFLLSSLLAAENIIRQNLSMISLWQERSVSFSSKSSNTSVASDTSNIYT